MKTYRLYQVDSFTREKFTGNPAGVVPNADGLTERDMQRIAREMNNSETAFVFKEKSDYDIRVRFFTPTTEVPVCGHATIAAHYVMAWEYGLLGRRTIRQETKAGVMPVTVQRRGGDYQIIMEQGEISVTPLSAPEAAEEIYRALGVSENEANKKCPIAIASTGHSKVMVGIDDVSVLHGLSPDLSALAALSEKIGCNGYYAFTLHPGEKDLVHGRMFAPAIGIAEDPVTGNANGPLGAYLCHYHLIDTTADTVTFTAVQGEKIRRRGTMKVEVSLQNDEPKKVRIIGEAVIVFKTEIII